MNEKSRALPAQLVRLHVTYRQRPPVEGLEMMFRHAAARTLALARQELRELGEPLPPERVEISVLLTGDEEIRVLNRRYRGTDAATDVLSFPQGDREEWIPSWWEELGDIVISVPTAQAQAAAYGHALEREIGFLFVHGLLHLLGFDHGEEEERARMRRLEEAVLGTLGLNR